jgi:SAM-dependent methyltransferase
METLALPERKYFEAALEELNVVQNIVISVLQRSTILEQKQSELQNIIQQGIHSVVKCWYEYEQKLIGEGLSPEAIQDLREDTLEHSVFKYFKYANSTQATRIGKKHCLELSLLEPESECSPGCPSAMAVMYSRIPKARGKHNKFEHILIEMHDKVFLDFIEIDLVIERLHRTADIICDDILWTKRELRQKFNYSILDLACGGNLLAREIENKLKAKGFLENDLQKVVVLGVDADARAEKFTFARNQNGILSTVGWKDTSQRGIRVEILKKNLLSVKAESTIQAWMNDNNVSGFNSVAVLGILDYFGCPVSGKTKVYIPEEKVSSFAAMIDSLTAPEGMIIGAVFAEEGLDVISAGCRHLFLNWHLNPVTRDVMQRRFPFLRTTDFQDVATAHRVSDAQKRTRINQGLHYFIHRKSEVTQAGLLDKQP